MKSLYTLINPMQRTGRTTARMLPVALLAALMLLAASFGYHSLFSAAARPSAELHVSAEKSETGCCWQITLTQKWGSPGNITKVVAKVTTPGATVTSAGNPWSTPPNWNANSITWTMPTAQGLNPDATVTACFNSLNTTVITLVFTGYDAMGNTSSLLVETLDIDDVSCNGCPVTPCRRPVTLVYEAGRNDSFAAPADPSAPRAALSSYMGCGVGPCANFDQTLDNRSFGHTFTGLPMNILSATLEIKLKATDLLATNDALHLEYNGSGFGWGRFLGTGGTLYPSSTAGLLGTPWNNGTQNTFTLDLASLPNQDGTTTCLLPSLNADRALDVYLQDDTSVDYIKLTIRACLCDSLPMTFLAGKTDAFAQPSDLSSRGSELNAVVGSWKDFDDFTTDRAVGHTFTGLPPGIIRAELEIRMQPIAGQTGNDAIHLGLNGAGGPPTFGWGSYIGNLPGANGFWGSDVIPVDPGPPSNARLGGGGGGLTPLSTPVTFTLDLGNLPPGFSGSSTNLLGMLASGKFDVYIQDDTAVDYIRLRVWTCVPLPRPLPSPVGVARTNDAPAPAPRRQGPARIEAATLGTEKFAVRQRA